MSNQKMANLKRLLNYSVLFFRSFGMTILFSYIYPNERIEVTSGDTFAMTYIKYHMKVSCLISFHESGDESQQFRYNFVSNSEHSLSCKLFFQEFCQPTYWNILYFKYFTTRDFMTKTALSLRHMSATESIDCCFIMHGTD